MRCRALACAVLVGVTACGTGESSVPLMSGTPDAMMLAGTAGDLPANAPARFDFGRRASDDRIALWDIDVRPDGAGLPPGRGSVAEGRAVYDVHCVACHGPTGTEGPNDQLVNSEQWDLYPTGRAVGNYWPYATTLYDYIRKAMPQLTPGILSHDQVYAVVAYVLYMNEIVPEDAVMDAQTLPAVVMPARDKFVVDDRIGGSGPVR
ncbi:MAG: cytochrome c [Gemmatimonadota bacterium]|nr:cytochrome c [Gemmatimonadota bacterium]MDH3424594.1 cytochrome c [Gemmatimonadota bacterium]